MPEPVIETVSDCPELALAGLTLVIVCAWEMQTDAIKPNKSVVVFFMVAKFSVINYLYFGMALKVIDLYLLLIINTDDIFSIWLLKIK